MALETLSVLIAGWAVGAPVAPDVEQVHIAQGGPAGSYPFTRQSTYPPLVNLLAGEIARPVSVV